MISGKFLFAKKTNHVIIAMVCFLFSLGMGYVMWVNININNSSNEVSF